MHDDPLKIDLRNKKTGEELTMEIIPADKSYKMPESRCLACHKKLDAATGARGDEAPPGPGMLTVCLNCGHLMSFDESQRLAEVPQDLMEDLMNNHPEDLRFIQDIQRKVRSSVAAVVLPKEDMKDILDQLAKKKP